MGELEKKVAVVTGGGRGLGRAICKLFAENGAQVYVCDVDFDVAEDVATEIKNSGHIACSLKIDVASTEEIRQAFTRILSEAGKVDILVNNAAICPSTLPEDIIEQEWDEVMAVNLRGVFFCCRAVMQSMISRKMGKIINISSSGGKNGGITAAGAHYSASKAGVICLTKSLATSLAPYGINVNSVAPGPMKTRMGGSIPESVLEQKKRLIPLGDFAEPEEVAEAVMFLASERAKFITGEIIDVNGGLYMD